MLLAHGTRLGPYEVIALIGAGGMGEVYRARDMRLDRFVALKVLSPRLASSESFRERFDREARSIAALSHPNICTLYDIGSQNDVDFLVMEFLEGETLALRLARQTSGTGTGTARTALPLDETLRIGTELADALTTAHRAGIIHRDLKPGNVMLTKRGAKVLDFGLAKSGAPVPAGGLEKSVTATAPLTGVDTLIGTLPYMAPEQLEGRASDNRTDIFALGAILYEMSTGRRAFSGESNASVIAAILDREPESVSRIAPATPPALDRLVGKCLSKDPDARWQSTSDIADELRWITSGSGAASPPAGRQPPLVRDVKSSIVVAAFAALILALAVAAAMWVRSRRTPDIPRPPQHRQATFDGNVLGTAVSPDGRTIAYAASRALDDVRVFVRDVGGGQSLEIWKGLAVQQLVWLPDGSRLALTGSIAGASGSLWLLPRLGGEARQLPFTASYVSPSSDGTELAIAGWAGGAFRVISLDGQERLRASLPISRLSQIEWTRDNRLVVLGANPKQLASVWSTSRDGQNAQELYSTSDRLAGICVSPATGAIYAIRQREEAADLLRLPATVQPGQLAHVVLSGLSVFETGFSITNGCSISSGGDRFVYRRGVQHANLWQLALDQPRAEATAITRGTSMLGLPAISPDGRWIAATQGTDATARVVRIPAEGGEPAEIATGRNPVWSPDGRRLAFISSRNGPGRVWVSDSQGQAAQEIQNSGVSNNHITWLPDGRVAWPSADARNYRIRNLATGQEEDLVPDSSVGWLIRVRFSPQGDRIAAFWNRPNDGRGLWLLSWPGREARFIAPGLWPVGWSADGQWIYAHKHGDGTMLRVSATTGAAEPAGRFPGVTLEGGCDLTPDRRQMVCALLERSSDAWLVEFFDSEAARQTPQ